MINVLLVDDEPDLLEQAKLFLEREDDSLDIKTAPSAKEALEQLKKESFDAIVSDYQMPKMDGLEFLEVVRDERESEIPFIIFTGKGREEVAMEALNLGADRYLQKGTDIKSQYKVLADAIVQEAEYFNIKDRFHLANFSLENADVGTLWISPGGKIRYANKRICQWLGYERDELTEMTISEIDPNFPDERPEVWEKIKEEGTATFDSEHRRKNGETFPVRITSHYLKRNGEEYEFAFVQDITEDRRREKKIRERRRAVEASDDSIYMIDRDFQYVFANEEHLSRLAKTGKISQRGKEKVVGEEYSNIHSEEEFQDFKENFRKVIETGEPVQEKYEIKNSDRWSSRTYSPVKNPETDEVEGVVIVSKDITERKKAEERFQHIFQNLGDAVFVTAIGDENNGEILEANDMAVGQTGWSEGELIGRNINDWLVEGPQEMTLEEANERLEGGESITLTTKRRRKDDSTYWVEETAVPIDYDGEEAVLSIYRDVTDRMEAEKKREEMRKELKKSKEKLTAIYEASPTPITLSTLEEGRYIEVNEAFTKLTGWDREEVIGKTSSDLGIWPESAEGERENLVEELRDRESIRNREVRFRNKEGEEGVGLLSAELIRIEGEEYILSNYIDITELKETEKRLERVKGRYEELFRNSNELMATTDLEGYIKRVNRKSVEYWGYSEEELVGESILKIAHPEDKDKYIEFWNEIVDSEEMVNKTLRGVTKEGEVCWLRAGGRPIIEDGEIVEIQYNSQDITELVETRNREEFLHSLLRHDVRNKAQIVKGYLDILREADLSEEYEMYLKNARKATERGIELIKKVKTLREIEEKDISEVDGESLIHEAVEKCKSTAEEKEIQIELDCPERECMVEGGPLLEELFSNLIENSIRHSEGNRIRISNKEREKDMIYIVEDDGKGISEEVRENIFDRGYSKGERGGSGLGMFLVKEIAENYGGLVEVKDSELGGARFDVHLKKTGT